VKQQKAAFSLFFFFILVITKLSMNKRIKVHEQKKKKNEKDIFSTQHFPQHHPRPDKLNLTAAIYIAVPLL
jgi:hypothetical protein